MKGLPGVALHLWIVPKPGVAVAVPAPAPGAIPKCRFINLDVVPGSSLSRKEFLSTVLLENPEGENPLSYERLQREV